MTDIELVLMQDFENNNFASCLNFVLCRYCSVSLRDQVN